MALGFLETLRPIKETPSYVAEREASSVPLQARLSTDSRASDDYVRGEQQVVVRKLDEAYIMLTGADEEKVACLKITDQN